MQTFDTRYENRVPFQTAEIKETNLVKMKWKSEGYNIKKDEIGGQAFLQTVGVQQQNMLIASRESNKEEHGSLCCFNGGYRLAVTTNFKSLGFLLQKSRFHQQSPAKQLSLGWFTITPSNYIFSLTKSFFLELRLIQRYITDTLRGQRYKL